jgi:prepilin-type processing-associated H-X9-DG protein
MLCPGCGQQNPEGALRCRSCGAAMAAATEAPWRNVQVPEPEPAPVPFRTSGMAIASLVLGLLGLFTLGVTALIGLVLGIVSLVQIQSSRGRLGGTGLAAAGIGISGTMLLFVVPILAAILFPVFAQARERARAAACMSNMKQLGMGLSMYVQDYDEHLPRKENWCDGLMLYVKDPKYFQCPSLPSEQGAQAYNASLSRVSVSEVVPPATVAVLEAQGGWNRSGGPSLAVPRHNQGLYVTFVDGHVKWVREVDSLIWQPGIGARPAPPRSR